MAAETRLRTMGSDAHVVVDGDPALLLTARTRLGQLDHRWSRFRPTSEISRLNAAEGSTTIVSPDTYRLVELALEAWRATSGRFDPTVLGDVVRAGYDRSFERIPRSRSEPPVSDLARGAAGIVLHPSVGAVALPPGVGFDPGGIGKGLAADLVAEELLAAGASGVCVNVGGDLRVAGSHLGAPRWPIAVDPDDDGHTRATVVLASGAVATSTRARRAWDINGQPAHHLIDPATGRPSTGRLVTVAVVAGQCWRAETLAKAAFVAGAHRALGVIDDAGASGLVIDDEGEMRLSSGMARFLSEEVAA